jgi:hypothetical protein
MLKKPCPYHKTPVNHTLEQCDMLNKYYSRAAAKDGEAKKDGVTVRPVVSPRWTTSSSSSGGWRPWILSYGPPWAHYLGGYQDRLLGGPLGLPGLHCTAPDGVKHKDYGGEVLG